MSDIVTVRETGAGALSYVLSPGHAFDLVSFSIKLSAIPSTSEIFTATKNVITGSTYDPPLYSKDFSELPVGLPPGVYFLCEREEFLFVNGDTLDFAWTNTDGLTYGLEVKYRRVP